MSRKSKKQAAQAAPVVKPFAVTLKPLEIVQPVAICQTFNSCSSAWEEPAPVAAPKKKKRGFFRRLFRFLLVVVLLAVVYAVAAYFVPALPLHAEITGIVAGFLG